MATTAWVSIEDVIAYLGADAPAADDAEGQARLEDAITSASELLYSLSGRNFPGVIGATVAPTPSSPGNAWPWNRQPYCNWGICWGFPHTRCEAPMFIGLGRAPIVEVSEVLIDGEVYDPINYHVDDQKWLMRNDCCAWPMCGCSCDNFIVTFTFGQDPPQLGTDAALILSAELYRSMTPGITNCRLPSRLTSITRQGVSLALIDPMDFMDKGLTGIYQIDMFIRAYNPGKQIKKPMVWSPDVPDKGRRQTWP